MTLSASLPAYFRQLEAESIFILREVAALARRPVLLYSIGKDSSVLLHLARKAFRPAALPFPLLHIDTTWKFREMIAFHDRMAAAGDIDMRIHVSAEGVACGINPFTHGSVIHNKVWKTDALRQALDLAGYDMAIGGARRDEERSRAKERIFSRRAPGHVWEPRHQCPELWRVYNTILKAGETMRVFPLSNWTERDIWAYIAAESIDIVSLYFAAPRPVVERHGGLVMVDDERFRLRSGEQPESRMVRFRSLGCYPFTSAVPSQAATITEIVEELHASRLSERAGRLIDHDQDNSMECKKREGYF